MTEPTRATYEALSRAYDFFNERLFCGQLPRCLITMQRKNGTFGYFAGERFGTRGGEETTDEIALNPRHFAERTTEEILSTLAHEMAHLWQHHFGTPSRSAYHNREWAAKMKSIGLAPSSTGAPGGKETGQKVSHYIAAGGPFAAACAELAGQGVAVSYVDLWGEEGEKTRRKKAASKTKYTCPSCGLNAWVKPDVVLLCGECEIALTEAFAASADEAAPEVPRRPGRGPQPPRAEP
jgi:hypothetical protein